MGVPMSRKAQFMRRTGLLLLVLAIAAVVWSVVGRSASASEGWLTDYDEALVEAERTGKPILADFSGSDWCKYCKKLDGEVFGTEQFKAWAADNVVLLLVDFPKYKRLPAKQRAKNETLMDTYGVQGFPTVLFLDEKGQVIARSGYRPGGAEPWIESAQIIVDKYAQSRRVVLAEDLATALARGAEEDRPILLVRASSAEQAEAGADGLLADPDFVGLANSRLAVVRTEPEDVAQLRQKLKADKDSSLLLVSADGKTLLLQTSAGKPPKELVKAIAEKLPKIPYQGQWLEDVQRARLIAEQDNKRARLVQVLQVPGRGDLLDRAVQGLR